MNMKYSGVRLASILAIACFIINAYLTISGNEQHSVDIIDSETMNFFHSLTEILPEAAPMRKGSVLIMQTDGRNIPVELQGFPNLTDEQVLSCKSPFLLSPIVNRMYACRHGYDYKFIRYHTPNFGRKDEAIFNMCRHVATGHKRQPAWCKIISLAYSFHLGYEYVLYLDTDAIFIDHEQSLEDFLQKEHRYQPESVALVSNATMIVTKEWNKTVLRKFHANCHAGVILMRNTEMTMPMLKFWWNAIPNSKWNSKFDAEQHVLGNIVFTNSTFHPHISTIAPAEMNSPFGRWIRHFSGKRRKPFVHHYLLQTKKIENIYSTKNCSLHVTVPLNATQVSTAILYEEPGKYNLSDSMFPRR